ncbi:CPBP family intramembrane glutamic endopeptidase [Psychrobacillus sp. FSL H8-0510]|uniref:CPBP family intramembrane glutamic endopeptidase n=1 Tax=Psychrobacillus sp. FSL H8-0510 TaxID=2921394 RepID=UPI0030FD1A7B
MHNKLSYSKKHPIISIILIEVIFLLVVFIAGAIATIKQLSYNTPILISFIPTALFLLFYFSWKRKWTYYGFKREIKRANWILYLPLLIILIVLCLQGFSSQPLETIIFYVGFAILIGFVEESIYRGIMIKILLPRGILPAILTSSILFSVTHMLNLLSGQSLGQTGLQLAYSFLIGIVLAQLFIKTGNILPLILFHSLHNLIQFLGSGGPSAILDTIVIIILGVTAILLSLSLNKKTERKLELISE